MYVKTENLSTIKQNNINTYYFYSRNEKMLLPLDVPCDISAEPTSADSIRRLLALFNTKVTLIKIYKEQGAKYYSYLNVSNGKAYYDVNICLKDALDLSDITKCPVYVKKDILYTSGIRVTKQLIADALGYTANSQAIN